MLRDGPLQPSELADALAISRPATSRHLRVLRLAGLIDQELLETDARARKIRLSLQPFCKLRSWLDQVEGLWTEQLDAFRSHVERRAPHKKTPRP